MADTDTFTDGIARNKDIFFCVWLIVQLANKKIYVRNVNVFFCARLVTLSMTLIKQCSSFWFGSLAAK